MRKYHNAEAVDHGTEPHTVLVVDDDRATQRLLAATLGAAGYRVLTAGNGREALDYLRDNKVDLVITDLVMPEIDGLELLRVLRMEPSSPPLIAMSVAPEYLQVAAALGARQTLLKPVDLDALLTMVKGVLRRE